MIPAPPPEIVILTEALFRRAVARLQGLAAQEARLRADLATLEARRLASRNLPEADYAGLRPIGADLLWQGWLGRNRARLNAELAMTLARKSKLQQRAQLAYGRYEAALAVQSEAAARAAREDRRRADRSISEGIVLRTGAGR